MRLASSPRGAWLLVALSACASARAPRAEVTQVVARTAVDSGAAPAAPTVAAIPSDHEGAVVPCTKDTADHAAATRALAALDTKIEALGDGGDPRSLVADVGALWGMPCFALAAEDGGSRFEWTSALSLRAWWKDGGHTWLEQYLQMDGAGERPFAVVAPTPRHALTADTAPGHPLAPLLCPSSAVATGSCGHETAGWMLRADRAFTMHATTHGSREDACAGTARAALSGWEYATFLQCVEDAGWRQTALPLGVFRAPTDGWLIIGTGVFISLAGCREDLRAYDLATGAAYVHRCLPGEQPPARTYVGRVPLGALREAAWMTMLEGTTDADVRMEVKWYDLPRGVLPARARGEKVPSQRMFISVTDQDRRMWSWMREKRGVLVGQASGSLEGPNGRTDAESLAFELLEVAEAGFERGCAPAPPPRSVRWNQLGPSVVPQVADHFDLDGPGLAGARAGIGGATASTRGCTPLP